MTALLPDDRDIGSAEAPPPSRPTALELASGVVLGEGWEPRLPQVPGSLTPRQALEESVLSALERTPCLVSFSGGRDSSAILAVATDVARRNGLPEPVPFTVRFPCVPMADETHWQELVVRHLALRHWQRHEAVDGELDFVGPVATRLMRRHSVLWPSNAHLVEPACRVAAGGSLLTGLEGDGLFGTWRWQHLAEVLAGRKRPQLRDPARAAIAAAPHALRRSLVRRGPSPAPPWLTPPARRAIEAAWRAHRAAEPARWDHRVEWYAGLRFHALACSAIGRIAADLGVSAFHPLLDRRFLAALARDGGRLGPGDRTRAMEALFADLLPEIVLHRQTKAAFNHAYFGPASRAFASAWLGPPLDRLGHWAGTAVDGRLLDPDALREAWAAEIPDDRSTSLLQAAYLASLPAPPPRTQRKVPAGSGTSSASSTVPMPDDTKANGPG